MERETYAVDRDRLAVLRRLERYRPEPVTHYFGRCRMSKIAAMTGPGVIGVSVGDYHPIARVFGIDVNIGRAAVKSFRCELDERHDGSRCVSLLESIFHGVSEE